MRSMDPLINCQAANDLKDYRLHDRLWRLNNLYYIINKHGKKVKFNLNWAQLLLFVGMHYFNVLLKARQLGMTTIICILFLDSALWNKTTSCGIIAHNREDAEKFFDKKIKFAYENLPEAIKRLRPANTDSAKQYRFNNGSSISVGTSLRSDTLQFLHISEYGKICAKYPEKAKEIRTGAINTVQAGNFCFIESTAEGNFGDYYNICQASLGKMRAGTKLTPLDFKFFFFPWWQHPEYTLASDDFEKEFLQMPIELTEYFKDLKNVDDITINEGQRLWYMKKYELQQDEMMREYPSTPEEAFSVPLRGAYYEVQIRRMIVERRLSKIPVDETLPVHTVWDLGIHDYMAFWFFQMVGKAIHIVDFYCNTDKGFGFYKKVLDDTGYRLGQHFAPHDIGARQHSSTDEPEERLEIAAKAGIDFIELPREMDVISGINRTRAMFNRFWMDSEKCSQGDNSGYGALQLYRKEFNEKNAMFYENPHKDWTNHGADSLRMLSLAVSLDMVSNTTYDKSAELARKAYIHRRDIINI